SRISPAGLARRWDRRNDLLQIGHRVDRHGIIANLEMQLWHFSRAGHARHRDFVAALDDVAPRDLELVGMAIDGDETVLMAQQHGIAEILQAVARIDDDAILGRLDRGSRRYGNIDTVIAATIHRFAEL